MSLKLISINIERSKHLGRVVPFLEKEKPDVCSVLELMERDISRFEALLGTPCIFAPMSVHPAEGVPGIIGIGFFSKYVASSTTAYYRGKDREIAAFDIRSAALKYATENMPLVVAEVVHEGQTYRIATTHFTWTPDGEPDEYQRIDMRALKDLLATHEDLVLCGDFNAPRGGEIFAALTALYTDNIPAHYVTSLDVNLHRATQEGKRSEIENKMVDGLFTTPEYRATDVRLEYGVSDHAAIVATIARVM